LLAAQVIRRGSLSGLPKCCESASERSLPLRRSGADRSSAGGMGPCGHPGKHPRFRNWQERATCDPTAIEEFWWNHKGANVAIATGAGSGIFVLDIQARAVGRVGRLSVETLAAPPPRPSQHSRRVHRQRRSLHAEAACDFCEQRRGRRVWAIKGMAGARPVWPRRQSGAAKGKVYVIGVDSCKMSIQQRLKLT